MIVFLTLHRDYIFNALCIYEKMFMNMNNDWKIVKPKKTRTIDNSISQEYKSIPNHNEILTPLKIFPTINKQINENVKLKTNKPEIIHDNKSENNLENNLESNLENIKSESNLENKMFVVFVTENGNGYVNENDQKIVTFGYDKKTIENIFNILYIINRNNTRNRKCLNINIIDYDMTILNFNYLNKYNELIDFNSTYIFSIEANNEQELSQLLITFFANMINDDNIKQMLYTRRKKIFKSRKVVFFLVKLFISKTYSIEFIKSNIFKNIDIKIKLKINDIEFDKSNKSEQGIKKNNWVNI